ncbi:MAG: YdeI/OmpD-associated family protein [Ginsengibacter sp.]
MIFIFVPMFMIEFSATILRFDAQGEKTGWSYIEIPAEVAQQIKPGNRKSFRVKGYLDNYYFKEKALLPMGDGNFIMALKADIRKAIRKRKGALLSVKMTADDKPVTLNADLMRCLDDEPEALSFFKTLTPGHRKYFSNWIDSAKTESTRATRIAHTITAMILKEDFGAMARRIKKERQDLLK